MMVKSVSTIVDDLNELLRRKSEPVGTLTWAEFYALCDMQRFKDPRGTQIKEMARAKYGLIVEYGATVVVVLHDRNFSPLGEAA